MSPTFDDGSSSAHFIAFCFISIAANVFQLVVMLVVPKTREVQGKVVARKALCDILLACSILAQLFGGECELEAFPPEFSRGCSWTLHKQQRNGWDGQL